MNAKELERIKSSIVPTKELITRTTPIALSEEICKSINCYAYALGIMWHDKSVFFKPGFTENICIGNPYDSEIIMKGICSDLENLGISYRQLDLDGKKSLEEKEYLIKLFFTKPRNSLTDGDFHFVRFDNCTNIWFHKMGWHLQPDIVRDGFGRRVEWKNSEPDRFYDSFMGIIEPLGYFVIKEK